MRTALAMLLVPIFWLAADFCLGFLRRLLQRRMPEGRLKRLALRPVFAEYFDGLGR